MPAYDAMMDPVDLSYWTPVLQINRVGVDRSLLMSEHMKDMMSEWENESLSMDEGSHTENNDFVENNDNSSEPEQVIDGCRDCDLHDATAQGASPKENQHDIDTQGEPKYPMLLKDNHIMRRFLETDNVLSDNGTLDKVNHSNEEASAEEIVPDQHETDSSTGDNVFESCPETDSSTGATVFDSCPETDSSTGDSVFESCLETDSSTDDNVSEYTECLSCTLFPRVLYPWCLAHKCEFTEKHRLGLNIQIPCAYNSIYGGAQCPSYLPPAWEDTQNQRPVMQDPGRGTPQSNQPCQDASDIATGTATVHGGPDSWKAITSCTNQGSEGAERRVDAKELENHTAEFKLLVNLMVLSKDLIEMITEEDEC